MPPSKEFRNLGVGGGGMQSYLLSNPTFRRLRVVKNMVLCKYER